MKTILFLMSVLVLTSCASQNINEEKQIQAKVAEEKSVKDPQSLGKTIHDLIRDSKNLTDAQKKELEAIIAKNKQTAISLSEESFKLRAVLIKELLSGNVNQKRVKLIKSDIKKVEAARLKNTFDAVHKISAMVAKHPDNHEYVDHLIFMERPQR